MTWCFEYLADNKETALKTLTSMKGISDLGRDSITHAIMGLREDFPVPLEENKSMVVYVKSAGFFAENRRRQQL